jgi:hypothetical protein
MEAEQIKARTAVVDLQPVMDAITNLQKKIAGEDVPDPTKSPVEFGSAAWFAGIEEIPFE